MSVDIHADTEAGFLGPTYLSELGASALALLMLAAVCQPGLLLGAAVTASWRAACAPRRAAIAALVLLAGAAAAVCRAGLILAWDFRLVASAFWHVPASSWLAAPPHLNLAGVLAVEALCGPAWLVGYQLAKAAHDSDGMRRLRKEEKRRQERLVRLASVGKEPPPVRPEEHPLDGILLGERLRDRKPFVVPFSNIASHIGVVGVSRSGKSVTVATIAEAWMAKGWPVLAADFKGGGSFRDTLQRLAQRYGGPYRVVDPRDADSLGLDPCVGDETDIANKLIGAFSYGDEAEVYKNIAMSAFPPIIRGLRCAGKPVSLETIARSLRADALRGLAMAAGAAANAAEQAAGDDPAARDAAELLAATQRRLADLAASGPTTQKSFDGMTGRLFALGEGKFGRLLVRARPALDLDEALASGVTYLSLPAMNASEDVELVARILLQDLKSAVERRMHTLHGSRVRALVILEEAAALREAVQLVDLFLQAAEAEITLCVVSQFLPELIPVRIGFTSGSIFVCHEVSDSGFQRGDAEAVAGLFGTREAKGMTQQFDAETGYSQKGTLRDTRQFKVHPDVLSNLPRGVAYVRIKTAAAVALEEVRIYPSTEARL